MREFKFAHIAPGGATRNICLKRFKFRFLSEFKFGHVAPGGATDNNILSAPKKLSARSRLSLLSGYGHIYFANKGLGKTKIHNALSISELGWGGVVMPCRR